MKKKSDTSNSSVEPEDSGSDLKRYDAEHKKLCTEKHAATLVAKGSRNSSKTGQYKDHNLIIEDFYSGRKPRESKIAPTLRSDRIGLKVINPKLLNFKGSSKESVAITATSYKEPPLVVPCIRAEHHNTADVHFVASGRMTSTNTPAKPTELDSETKNSLRGTSEISKQSKFLNLTYLQLDFPARVFPLPENVKVFKTEQKELFSSKSAGSLEIKDQASYSLRMLKDYFLTTEAEPSQLYSFRWMNLGIMSNGRCLTLNIGCPKTGKGSLSSVLEEKVDKKYYLSQKMLDYLKRHVDGRATASENDEAYSLTNSDHKGLSKQRFNVIQCGHRTKGKPRFYKDQIPAMTQDYGTGGQNIPLILQRARGKNKGGERKICPSITSNDFQSNNLLKSQKIRRLTPRECERLQGFPDDWTKECSDTQRYKQMGNAVSVPVIEAIGKKIIENIS